MTYAFELVETYKSSKLGITRNYETSWLCLISMPPQDVSNKSLRSRLSNFSICTRLPSRCYEWSFLFLNFLLDHLPSGNETLFFYALLPPYSHSLSLPLSLSLSHTLSNSDRFFFLKKITNFSQKRFQRVVFNLFFCPPPRYEKFFDTFFGQLSSVKKWHFWQFFELPPFTIQSLTR